LSSTISEIGLKKDFEVIWIDNTSQLLKDLDDVTLEIYHYEEAMAPKLVSSLAEPYIVTEGLTDSLNVLSINSASGFIIDKPITLDLNVIINQLPELGCPPNGFVVPGTTEKISVVNGNKQFALSACELATLINLEASGYSASDEGGFLILTGDFTGPESSLEMNDGSLNCVIGSITGDTASGTDITRILDLFPKIMTRIDTGRYVCLAVHLTVPPFILGERYFALFKGLDPITNRFEFHQEDFTLVNKIGGQVGLHFSFLK